MALEFEKLSDKIENMSATVLRLQQQREKAITRLLGKVQERTFVDSSQIRNCRAQVLEQMDPKLYRSAEPIFPNETLCQAIDPPKPPQQATIISADGSQILPDRHAPYLYYLINVGLIVYAHGSAEAPSTKAIPTLRFPSEDADDYIEGEFTSSMVSIRRDIEEISRLADEVWENRYARSPILALLDQRLLYWPIGSGTANNDDVIQEWLAAMLKVRDSGGLLAGYIDRPQTSAVVNLLHTLDVNEADFDIEVLKRRSPILNDTHLFGRILKPGQRSPVFIFYEESDRIKQFKEAGQEVCFFYINPATYGQTIARVDIPLWAAQQPEVVAQIHALVYSQCQILGGYPYVLTRADEIAVVKRADQEYLNRAIDVQMQRKGVAQSGTAKQAGKDVARAGKQRHQL